MPNTRFLFVDLSGLGGVSHNIEESNTAQDHNNLKNIVVAKCFLCATDRHGSC